MTTLKSQARLQVGGVKTVSSIDLFHGARHLFTRFRIDGIEAMSRGISGGKQKIKFVNARNRGRLCLFSQNETTI